RGVLIGWLAFAGALGSTWVLYLFFRKAVHHTLNTAKLWVLTHKDRLARTRWAWALGGATLLLVALFVPYPGTIKRPVTLHAGRLAMISAPDTLFLLDERYAGGEAVRAGDTLAVLDAREYAVGAAGLE